MTRVHEQLAADPSPPADRRKAGEARYVTILLVAKIIHGDRDNLCRIRNISGGGMMIETAATLSVGEAVCVELRNLHRVCGLVVWARAGRFGIQFDQVIDVRAILANASQRNQDEPAPRSPRVITDCPVELRRAGKTLHAVVRNLSQTGCRLASEVPLGIDERIFVNIPGLEPRRAVIRWSGEGEAGAGFVDTIAFGQLSAWLQDEEIRFSQPSEQ